jgi:low affinity Fe/Cu permease
VHSYNESKYDLEFRKTDLSVRVIDHKKEKAMMNEIFRRFSKGISDLMGTPWAFGIALSVIVVWAVTGPIFGYSDTWQLIINTGTTIVTFLMVFLIQNTQNRDAKAIHLKLDELIRSATEARDSMLNLQDLSDKELETLQSQFERLRNGHNGGLQESLKTVEQELEERQREFSKSAA